MSVTVYAYMQFRVYIYEVEELPHGDDLGI